MSDATTEKKTQLLPGWTEGCAVEKYECGCHCGKFKIDFEHPKVVKGDICNCSICHMRGAVLVYVPYDHLKFTNAPAEEIATYMFGKKLIEHMFCPVCGIPFIGRGYGAWAVNLRCVKDVDIEKIEINKHDGASL